MFLILIVVAFIFIRCMGLCGNNPDNTVTPEEQEKYGEQNSNGDGFHDIG